MGHVGSIGDIRLFAELSRGRSHAVYKGYQESLQRFVLVKTLEVAEGDDQLAEQFETEARALARIQHPNVVAVYDYGKSGSRHFIATEFVEGVSLRSLIERGPIPTEIALYLTREIVQGLAAAHERGVLHHDIKPENILVSADGKVKLVDFGLASIEHNPLSPRGTLVYMAPEEIHTGTSVLESDYFSVGTCLFEMIQGFAPFAGADDSELMSDILGAEPIKSRMLSTPEEPVLALLNGLLQKSPVERLADPETVLKAIESALDTDKPNRTQLVAFIESPTAVRDHKTKRASPIEPGSAPKIDSVRKRRVWPRYVVPIAIVIAVGAGWFLQSRMTQGGGAATSAIPLPNDTTQSAQTARQSELPTSPTTTLDSADVATDETDRSPELLLTSQAQEDSVQIVPADTAIAELVSEVLASSTESTDISIAGDSTIENYPASPIDSVSNTISSSATTVDIVTTPWAEVEVEGQAIGSSPLRGVQLQHGEITLTFRNPSLPAVSITTRVDADNPETINVSLWDYVSQVRLEISPWAVVYVDSVVRDTIPPQKEAIILEPGLHDFRLVHTMGEYRGSWNVEAGSTYVWKYNLFDLIR